jgi:hypothetical protein
MTSAAFVDRGDSQGRRSSREVWTFHRGCPGSSRSGPLFLGPGLPASIHKPGALLVRDEPHGSEGALCMCYEAPVFSPCSPRPCLSLSHSSYFWPLVFGFSELFT